MPNQKDLAILEQGVEKDADEPLSIEIFDAGGALDPSFGTGGITGVYYPTGGAIAKMVNAKRKEYGIRATVESRIDRPIALEIYTLPAYHWSSSAEANK